MAAPKKSDRREALAPSEVTEAERTFVGRRAGEWWFDPSTAPDPEVTGAVQGSRGQ